MWVLVNEADVLDGEGQFVIPDKTISRNHLTVEVGPIAPSDCMRGKIHVLDGDKNLDGDENVVQLGRFKHCFFVPGSSCSFTRSRCFHTLLPLKERLMIPNLINISLPAKSEYTDQPAIHRTRAEKNMF
ncbi:hypothetical protein DL95DRAFT_500323 [Leptodontidium sp. 2 PMI_412]|nr:hypothetical protein DL95DRAFT_500323 [Leptodontidium sp. 2 PMI_412]